MRTAIFTLAATQLASVVFAAACPYEHLKRTGLLSPEDEAKFDAVKRDPAAADALFHAHQLDRREASSESTKLAGPMSKDGILDLPLGGGLCTSRYFILIDPTDK